MNTKEKAENLYKRYLKEIEKIIGNKTTSNTELDYVGKKLFPRNYKGTVASNEIPILKNKDYLIVNNQDNTKMGEHRLAVVKDKDKVIVYDSFGRKHYKILPSLKQSGNGYVLETENDPEQDKLEDNCGSRCLSALMVYHFHGPEYFKFI